MNKLKGNIALLILIISWVAIFIITGSHSPWTYFRDLENKTGGISVHLGDIPIQNYDRMGFSKAVVRYVPSENGWIVGTERGELTLFDNQGKQLWKRNLGLGKLISLTVAENADMVIVGEQSIEGNFYAFNTHTGDIIWQYKGSDFIGSDAGQHSYPSVVHIAMDKDNNAYVNVYRFLMTQDGSRTSKSKMIAVAESGELLWQFPPTDSGQKNEDFAMDTWINWCDVSDKSEKVVLSTSSYEYREYVKYNDTMYIMDKKSGRLLHTILVPFIKPFNNTVMRGSPNFSKDGNLLAAACSDGRGMLFDSEGKMLWSRNVSVPTLVDGSWLNAGGRDGFVTSYGVIFSTISTFNRENWQLPTPVEHSSSNSIFVFTEDGKFNYQYQADGAMEELGLADNLLVCAIGRNVRTHNYQAHGILVLDLRYGSKYNFYHTEGPTQSVAISSDGRYVAGVEVPAITPEGKTIGSHRLHIWKNQKE